MTHCDRLDYSDRFAGWKHGAVVGLTGAIGGGKSTAAARLALRGALVIDADAVGHQVLNEPSLRNRLVKRFGPTIVSTTAAAPSPIDRRALGAIVFADESARRDLESIVHPTMRERFVAQIAQTVQTRSASLIVLDAAILFEAGWNDLCDKVVYVDAPAAVRLERIQRSRGWSADRLSARERAQAPAAEKRARADFVIDNSGDSAGLDRELDRLAEFLGDPFSGASPIRGAAADLPAARGASSPFSSTDDEPALGRGSTRSPLSDRTRRL